MAQVKVVKRNENENYELNELLEEAQGKIQEALGHVTYSAYPEINTDVVKKLKQIEDDIVDILIAIENGEICKPVKC